MKKIVVLTGAGMSAESGIATFRDSGGLWDKYPVEDVATPEGFARNPKLVLEFYNIRRKELLSSKPNQGHLGLAELERDFEVKIITQNIDNLHEQAGSTSVLHLHGELMKAQSVKNPNLVVELSPGNYEIQLGDKASDGAQLRPFIVWFGEAVPMIEPAIELCAQADIFIIIGTSLNVYPAAGLLNYVPQGIPVYLIDPKEVTASRDGIHFIRRGASQGVGELVQQLKKTYL
jgi:NAD-dependent deacetylase